MDDLIEYINGGSCILFLGAGVSRAAGLPDWPVLTGYIAEDFQAKIDKEKIAAHLAARHFPRVFDEISRVIGDNDLLQACRNRLSWDPNRPLPHFYSALLTWRFQAFFTTNFDDLIRIGLKQSGIVTSVHSNSRNDLSSVDIDSVLSIIKIHGDLFPDSSKSTTEQQIVLTEKQYLRAEVGDDLKYLRDFLASYLRSKRMLFVGYSFSDPDIQLVLKQVAVNLRRSVPLYAILADITDDKVDELYRNFNIRVIPYRNTSGSHKELETMIETLNDYILPRTATSPRPVDPVSLKRAQSLYFWHKLQMGNDVSVHVDAIKSLIINAAGDNESKSLPSRKDDLIKAIQPLTGLSITLLTPIADTAIKQLITDSFLAEAKDDYLALSQKARDLTKQYSSQYQILINTFKDQSKLDFSKIDESLNSDQLGEIAEIIFETLIDVLSERAVEIIGTVWESTTRPQRPARLFKLIAQRAGAIQPAHISYEIIRYVTRILTDPFGVQEQLLQYLSRAFVCASALSMDPEGNRFKREFLRERSVFIDANVLIPALAIQSVSHEFLSKVILALRDEQVPVFTTEGFVDELHAHGAWAKWMVGNSGQYSYEVYEAAIGAGHYKKNAFLDGFIRYCTDVDECSFEEYLAKCTGGKFFSMRNVQQFIEKNLGIKLVTLKELAEKKREVYADRTDVEEFVKEQAALRELEKSDARASAESEVYAIIANWNVLRPANAGDGNWRAALLSQGAFLNRIARDGPHPLNYNVVMRADAVYELLIRLGQPTEAFTSTKDVILSSYFHSSIHFIDMAKYKKYFGSLIAEAEQVYKRDYVEFQKYLNHNFTTDYLDEFEDIDKPLVVRAFEEQLKAKLEGLTHEIEEEKKARLQVEKELARYKDEERRRKEHIEKSKKRLARKAQIGKPGKRSNRLGKGSRKKRH